MSWARNQVTRTDYGTRSTDRGYSHKLCPYSTEYRDRYQYTGEVCTGFDAQNKPIKVVGSYVIGNSVNPDFYLAEYDTYECSDHTTTGGEMIYTSNPPGWRCEDPDCYYFTTVESGRCYREV